MPNTNKKLPGRPRSIKSHKAILEATLALLGEVGLEKMSIDAIANRAGVGKTTIYRRYSGKEELVADAIESIRFEIAIPDTGSLWGDIDALIENAARITLNPLGRQTLATILSSASRNPQFAKIYWRKYLEPRRQEFTAILDRAKIRKEVSGELDSGLVFNTISGIMLYALIFEPENESWQSYVSRAIHLLLN